MKQSAEQINQTIIPVFISVSRLVSSFHTCSLKARSDWTVTSPTFDVAPAQGDSAPSVIHSTIYLPSPPSQRVSDPAPLAVLPCHVGAVCGLREIADIIDNPIATPTAGDTEAG